MYTSIPLSPPVNTKLMSHNNNYLVIDLSQTPQVFLPISSRCCPTALVLFWIHRYFPSLEGSHIGNGGLCVNCSVQGSKWLSCAVVSNGLKLDVHDEHVLSAWVCVCCVCMCVCVCVCVRINFVCMQACKVIINKNWLQWNLECWQIPKCACCWNVG